LNDRLREAAERLRAAGIESPRADARLLCDHAQTEGASFEHLIERRLRREPVAYIAGRKEFWSLDFAVGPGVLIPRPETETLVEEALKQLPESDGAYRVLDLGTGTGCLLLAFLSERPKARGIGLDNSAIALEWASRNVARHGLEPRVQLVHGGWQHAEGYFDLIFCNPPYVPTADLAGLPSDVGDYEPRAALDGGPDGLSAYRAIAPVLKRHLKSNGVVLLEIGAGQHHVVEQIVAAEGLKAPRIAADLAGIPRCLVVRAR
jgi:release factor glutamine methyltransferase